MGLTGFEPVTSPLSGVRSNQLSYRPRPTHSPDASSNATIRRAAKRKPTQQPRQHLRRYPPAPHAAARCYRLRP